MVVDDDPFLLRLYQHLLEKLDLESIVYAKNGKDAVAQIQNLEVLPDIILMDYRMPLMNGVEAMIRIHKMTSQIKIIFVSADLAMREKVLQLGANAFLAKPFDIIELHNTIKGCMYNVCEREC